MYYKYKKMGFMTPTKKVELSSKRLHDMGYDALPVYRMAPVGPFNTSMVTEEYPIVLTTGSKIQGYVHSQMRNLPSLRHQFPQNVVELHPYTAEELNVIDEDMVVIGQFSISLSISVDLRAIAALMSFAITLPLLLYLMPS